MQKVNDLKIIIFRLNYSNINESYLEKTIRNFRILTFLTKNFLIIKFFLGLSTAKWRLKANAKCGLRLRCYFVVINCNAPKHNCILDRHLIQSQHKTMQNEKRIEYLKAEFSFEFWCWIFRLNCCGWLKCELIGENWMIWKQFLNSRSGFCTE